MRAAELTADWQNMKYITNDKEIKKILRAAECNARSVAESERCLCLFCGRVISAKDIILTGRDILDSAVCPFCGYDAILPSAAGLFPTEEQMAATGEALRAGIDTVCYLLSVRRGGVTLKMLFPRNADLDTLAHSLIAIFDIPLGEHYDFHDYSRRYFFKRPYRTSDRDRPTAGTPLGRMDIADKFNMWCLGDVVIAPEGEIETGERHPFPVVTAVEGEGLTLAEARARLLTGYIKTRNFYWTYMSED